MSRPRPIWMIVNAASGSSYAGVHDTLERHCGDAGFSVGRMIRFPDEALPSAHQLETAGIDLVAVFAGDGTTNALVTSLYGWNGAILVLPGGTMNLLYRRLHGDAAMETVIHAAARGEAQRVRPGVIRSVHGDALAGLVAGPGTAWYEVREAMREADLLGIADTTARAIEESLAGPMVVCAEPSLGRAEGYPLIMLTPDGEGFRVSGYHSETAEDYLAQAIALVRRNFREGPHDDLGATARLTVESVAGERFGLSLDGELKTGGPSETFELAYCAVDLLATGYHG